MTVTVTDPDFNFLNSIGNHFVTNGSSGISKPVVWGTRGLHPGFPRFSSFSRFP